MYVSNSCSCVGLTRLCHVTITTDLLTIVRTNGDSECFSIKSLSPNSTTNLHQSESDRCRSKYDLRIVMFTTEKAKCDARQFLARALYWKWGPQTS
jgi:hypothetical protein